MTMTRRHPFVCVFLLLWTQHIALNFVKNVVGICWYKSNKSISYNKSNTSLCIWLCGYIASSKPTFWGNISNTWRLLTLICTSVYWDLIDEVHHSIICLHLGEASIQVVCTIQKGWWVLDMYLDKANIACRLF